MSNAETEFGQLLADPQAPLNLSRDQCAALLAQVKALEGRLLARLLADNQNATNGEASAADSDRLLTIAQAAQLLSVSKSWLYHRAARLGLARKLGDGTLRFSYAACQRFIKQAGVSRA